jgi:S1-C subfamily serine protease
MRTLIAFLAIAVFPVFGPAGDGPEPAVKSPASLQAAIASVLKKVTPSVVCIWHGKSPRSNLSGVIVSEDGLIITAGHIHCKVGEAVEINLPGKKRVDGKVLAKLKESDLALVQITERGAWPAVEVGASATITDLDPLLALGFGDTGLSGSYSTEPPCYARLGYRREPLLRYKDGLLPTTVPAKGGDSGSPLFDLTGSLVGICSAGEADGTDASYVPSAVLLRAWRDLAGERPGPARSSARRPIVETVEAATAKGVRALRPSVVEIWSDERWAGVGVYVGDGFIVTKASELGRQLSVVLRNDVVAGVDVSANDPARDLALLKLWNPDFADAITPVAWADVKDLPAGTILAAVTPPAFTPPTGVTCVSARSIPPLPGCLPIQVKDAEGGVEVTGRFDWLMRWLRPPPFPLQEGDVITKVAGLPVQNREAFIKLMSRPAVGDHPRVMGEVVLVTYRRKGKRNDVPIHLREQHTVASQRVRPCSYRYSGFPAAIASDLAARPEHCGAPVVDADGRVVGLLIAHAPFIESLILPSAAVKTSVEAMRQSATAKK